MLYRTQSTVSRTAEHVTRLYYNTVDVCFLSGRGALLNTIILFFYFHLHHHPPWSFTPLIPLVQPLADGAGLGLTGYYAAVESSG